HELVALHAANVQLRGIERLPAFGSTLFANDDGEGMAINVWGRIHGRMAYSFRAGVSCQLVCLAVTRKNWASGMSYRTATARATATLQSSPTSPALAGRDDASPRARVEYL